MRNPVFAAIALALNFDGLAGQNTDEAAAAKFPFDQGEHEFQISSGVFTSLVNDPPKRPRISDADESLRLGWMLWTPRGDGIFHGNLEFLIEAYGALDIQGPGTGFVGGNVMLRYNFVQPTARWVPYVQIQGGGIHTDINRDLYQRLIGGDTEFFLGAGFGVRCFIKDRVALSIEAGFRHNSNANTADRNIGLNSVGALVGLSVFF